jgi:hypothetical protein
VYPGDEVDVCVVPCYEPHWEHPKRFEWWYRTAWRRAGSDYVYYDRPDNCRTGTTDFGLIDTQFSGPNWDIETTRAHQRGQGIYLYEPASDDPELCPGGDWSRYECSLCGKFVKPFSDDQGELICPWCEVTGLVLIDDEQLDRLEQVREFARSMGLSAQLEHQLDFLNYGYGNGQQCQLGYDFAPHSFAFAHYLLPHAAKSGQRTFSYNGGLIYQGPGSPGDGSFPSLTVSLAEGTGWFCHT